MKKQFLNVLICFMPLTSPAQQKPQNPTETQSKASLDVHTEFKVPKQDTIIYSNDSIPLLVVSYMGSRSWIIKSYYESGSIYQIQYKRKRERVTFFYDQSGELFEAEIIQGRRNSRVLNKNGAIAYQTRNTFVEVEVR